jgi:hypothetical protein
VPNVEAVCINTERRRKPGGEELEYSSGLRKLEAGSGFCLRLSFHWGTFAGDLGGFLWGRRDTVCGATVCCI